MSDQITQPTADTAPHTITMPLAEWHALLRLLLGKAPIYHASERGRFVATIATQLAAPVGGSTAPNPETDEDTHDPT